MRLRKARLQNENTQFYFQLHEKANFYQALPLNCFYFIRKNFSSDSGVCNKVNE